jgi:hypothetical protein
MDHRHDFCYGRAFLQNDRSSVGSNDPLDPSDGRERLATWTLSLTFLEHLQQLDIFYLAYLVFCQLLNKKSLQQLDIIHFQTHI